MSLSNMWITDNNHVDMVSENIIQIFKSDICILRMQLQILEIAAFASTCTLLTTVI
jgi:hypothetical protein